MSSPRTIQMAHVRVQALLPNICSGQYRLWPGPKYTDLFALALPHFNTLCSCSSVHVSRSTDLTRLICVPIPRCIPEHLFIVNGRTKHTRGGGRTECTQRCLGSSWPIEDLVGDVSTPDRPSFTHIRTLVPLAICAALVCLDLNQTFQCLSVLLRAIGGGISPPRHGVILRWAQGDGRCVRWAALRDGAGANARYLFGRVRPWYGKSIYGTSPRGAPKTLGLAL